MSMSVKYKLDGKPCILKKATRLVDAKYGKGALALRALQGIRKAARNQLHKTEQIELDGHILEMEFNI